MNIDDFESISLFCLTPNGIKLAQRICEHIPAEVYCQAKYANAERHAFSGSLAQEVAHHFKQHQALVFIGASGIAVRMIAPLLKDKLCDPAVIVVDELGQNVISLLSGHVGGANELSHHLARALGAHPIITTATDVNELASLDLLAQEMHASFANMKTATKFVNQALLSGKHVGLLVDPELVELTGFSLADYDTRGFEILTRLNQATTSLDVLVYISIRDICPTMTIPVIKLVPKRIVLGIGCRRGIDSEKLSELISKTLLKMGVSQRAVAAIGSIDIKADEIALHDLCAEYGLSLQLFSAQELMVYEHHFPQSTFVRQTVGVGSVSQPATWIMSNGHLLGKTIKEKGISLTVGVIH